MVSENRTEKVDSRLLKPIKCLFSAPLRAKNAKNKKKIYAERKTARRFIYLDLSDDSRVHTISFSSVRILLHITSSLTIRSERTSILNFFHR